VQLRAFQDLVRVEVGRSDPVLAATLIQAAQQVIGALSAGNGHPGDPPPCRVTRMDPRGDGCSALQVLGEPGRIHIVEASTNLVTWEMIGLAEEQDDGTFAFGDVNAAKFPCRYYRIKQMTP